MVRRARVGSLFRVVVQRREQRSLREEEPTEWMTIEEAAAYLRTSVRHLRDLVYRREIPFSKLGKLLRFHRETINKWMLSPNHGE